jgi:hypothetical protein
LKGDRNNAAAIVRSNVRHKWLIDLPTPQGGRPTLCLFEPGAYQLSGNPMFQTKLAEKFQDWLYEEILPKLRANGTYFVNIVSVNFQTEVFNATNKSLKLLDRVETLSDRLEQELLSIPIGSIPENLVNGFGVAMGAIRRTASKQIQFSELFNLLSQKEENLKLLNKMLKEHGEE